MEESDEAASLADRNHAITRINWHFNTDNAREKLKSLYSKFDVVVPG